MYGDMKSPGGARNQHTRLVELLLVHGAKVDTTDRELRTALHYAALAGDTAGDLVQAVLKYVTATVSEFVVVYSLFSGQVQAGHHGPGPAGGHRPALPGQGGGRQGSAGGAEAAAAGHGARPGAGQPRQHCRSDRGPRGGLAGTHRLPHSFERFQ